MPSRIFFLLGILEIVCQLISCSTRNSPSRVVLYAPFYQHGAAKRQIPNPSRLSAAVRPLPAMPSISMPRVDATELANVVIQANEAVNNKLNSIEALLKDGEADQIIGSPEWFAAASSKTTAEAKNVSRVALVAEEATRLMAHSLNLNKDQITYGLPTTDIRKTLLAENCPLEVDFPCQPRKYRAHSGYCNNVQNPRWGNANIKYLRFLPADYADGVSIPRQSIDGAALPNAREVSFGVHLDVDKPHQYVTSILSVWAQFVYLDVAFTGQVVGKDGKRLRCCQVNSNHLHPECYPVTIPFNDPVYGKSRVTCQDYIRSCMGPRTGCTLGPREQVNQVTAFLDATVVYGSSEEECQNLRSFNSGLLKTQQSPSGNKGLLPPELNPEDCRSSSRFKCFKAGDYRINENVGLTILQTLWVREHNRIAKQMKIVNPHWTDEILFQEARRIVAAEIQQITFNEFLPIVLGETIMDRYGLKLKASHHYSGYDINVNPGLSNAVATAALKFFYSLTPSSFQLLDPTHRVLSSRPISSTFYNPSDIYDVRKLDEYIRGLISQKIQTHDEFVTKELTSRWFGNNTKVGMDSIADVLQRGRDHAIPGYVKWREFCGLPMANSFEDLQDVMTRDTTTRLKRTYKKVADIDLFTGGSAEVASKGALVGPTFGCLLARQFSHLRRGDRYWFENDIPPSSFNKEQLAEIRKSTLARVICDNGDNVYYVQPKAMLEADEFLNAFMECNGDSFPSINLKKWRTASTNFVIPSSIIQESVERGKRQVGELRLDEYRMFAENIGIVDDKSPHGTSSALLRPKRQAIQISNSSLILQFATQTFLNSFMQEHLKDVESSTNLSVPVDELMKILPNIDVSEFVEIPQVFECDEQTLPCDHTSKFRTFTGWCNNLEKPKRGKSFTIFQRLTPPQYADGLSSPRSRGVSNSILPSPRFVSTMAHPDITKPHVRYSLMVMQFAQFVDHDLTFTPVHTGFQGSLLDCRSCDSAQTVHPECFPIQVPLNDPYFPPLNSTTTTPRCLALVRSLPGQLTMGPRQQINQATAFVDASVIYGSDVCVSRDLRSFAGGRLNSTRYGALRKELLPETLTIKECRATNGICFKAGDNRPSEQPGLACMHTIWLREHNRIVGRLATINPQWDDETLFQNGRRIVSSIFQHIVYNEFLPRILGWSAIHKYELDVLTEDYYDKYDQTCNPTIVNEFSTAAFRFGHSLIKPTIQRMDNFYNNLEPLPLRHRFFVSDDLYKPGMIDELLRGLATASMETLDPFITKAVTNHLFEDRKNQFSGLDLVALNIQRAREHGIGTYNQIRKLCNLTRASRFEDLLKEMPNGSIQRLKAIYQHPDDIDLFTGGMLETSLHGGVVGPTFACVIGKQFSLLRRCDRFWYENSNPLTRFTEAQLSEIRKSSLSKVICENSENIDTIQRSIFDLTDSFLNPRVPCHSIPSIDLEAWKERVTCSVGPLTINIGLAERVSPCVMCTCTREGPLCQSLKITDCITLANKFSREAILRDHVCKVQCAFAFRSFPSLSPDDSLLSISNA
ncbi:hypothetical protein CHUAL_008055 [Chamberlinius hualienensis]